MDELPNRYYYYRVGRAVKRATRSDFADGYIQSAVLNRTIPPFDYEGHVWPKCRVVRRKVKVVIAPSWAEAVDFIKRTNA